MPFIFEQASLSAVTNTTIRTVAANNKGIFDINVCKTTTGNAVVNISVTVGATTTYLEHGVSIPHGTPLLRTKEMFPSGAIIKVESDVAGVDVTLSGIEEAA